jgi:hypothetical protein
MNGDLLSLTLIPELTADDLEFFKTAVHTLLAKTFIIRGVDSDELYNFTVQNQSLFDAWFACMDASVVRDESLGVICFRGHGDTRARLNREETCALLVMRLLYEEKRIEISLASFPTVTISGFVQRYNAMVEDDIKKTHLLSVLRRLQGFKLIEVNSPDLSDMESLIILYPSIALAVDRDSVDELAASLKRKGGTPALEALADITPNLDDVEEYAQENSGGGE